MHMNEMGPHAWDRAHSSLSFHPQPSCEWAGGRQWQGRGQSVLLTASVLTLGCSQGQCPTQWPNRIHIHEWPLSLSNGLGTASACRMCPLHFPNSSRRLGQAVCVNRACSSEPSFGRQGTAL